MKQLNIALYGGSAALLCLVGTLVAADSDPVSTDAAKPQPVKATFLITGLHCPPCTSTVENSIKSVKGVKSIKVDWTTKNAKVEFDEQQITAQQLSGKIAATAHMMGGQMKYSGWLALKVPEIGAEGNADKAKTALAKIKGVGTVAVYVPQKSIGVAFSGQGNLTSTELIDALKATGLEASVLP